MNAEIHHSQVSTSTNDVTQPPIEALGTTGDGIHHGVHQSQYEATDRQVQKQCTNVERNTESSITVERDETPVTVQTTSIMESRKSGCCEKTITLNSVGATLIIMGVVSFIVSIIMIFDVRSEDYLSQGYDGRTEMSPSVYMYKFPGLWGAVFLIVDGGMSLCASKKRTRCLHTANFALSLITCILMTIYFLLSIVSVSVELNGAARVLYFIHIIISIVGLFTCICTASINSKQICKSKQRSTVGEVTSMQQQFVQLSYGQCMALPQNNQFIPTIYQMEPSLYPPPPPPYTLLTGPPPYSENEQEIPGSHPPNYDVSSHQIVYAIQ